MGKIRALSVTRDFAMARPKERELIASAFPPTLFADAGKLYGKKLNLPSGVVSAGKLSCHAGNLTHRPGPCRLPGETFGSVNIPCHAFIESKWTCLAMFRTGGCIAFPASGSSDLQEHLRGCCVALACSWQRVRQQISSALPCTHSRLVRRPL